MSVLSIAELRIEITIQADAKKRNALEAWLVSELNPRFTGRLLDLDLDVAQLWGRMEGKARLASGKLPAVDSQLAATALYHGLTLVTNNEADFSRTGVAILNPST